MRFESLPFEVDFFGCRPGRAKEARAYFLTHAHADHLSGLGSSASPPIYCTAATAALAAHRTGAPPARFRHLQLRQPTPIYANDEDSCERVTVVTALPANHCIGACMLVFDGPFGRVLHTGDFRFGASVPHDILPYVRTVDTLFLDCTYGHPSFDFPSQDDAQRACIQAVSDEWRGGEGADVFIGSDKLGKEELFAAIARSCNTRVLVDHEHFATISAGDATMEPFFAPPPPCARRDRHLLALPCTVPVSPRASKARRRGYAPAIRVVPWWAITARSLKRWEARAGCTPSALLPTGCLSRLRGAPGTYINYTSHSSFRELVSFVRALQPRTVASTPETALYTAQDGLCRDPTTWFSSFLIPRPLADLDRRSVTVRPGPPHALVRLLGGGSAPTQNCTDDGLGRQLAAPRKRRRRHARSPLPRVGTDEAQTVPPSARLLHLMRPVLEAKVPKFVGLRAKSRKRRRTDDASESSYSGPSPTGDVLVMPRIRPGASAAPAKASQGRDDAEGRGAPLPPVTELALVDRHGAGLPLRIACQEHRFEQKLSCASNLLN